MHHQSYTAMSFSYIYFFQKFWKTMFISKVVLKSYISENCKPFLTQTSCMAIVNS